MGKIANVVEVTSARNMQEVLEQSNTDWDVVVEKSKREGGFAALVRPDTDTELAWVGQRFRVNNHRAQLMPLDALIQSGDIQPVSVSMWDNGGILAYQFRCPSLDVTVHSKDIVSPLLTLAFSYGSQLADSAFFSDFRWFCKNQLGQVAKLNKDHRVKHRGAIVERFGEIVLSRLQELSGELSDRYKAMRAMTTKELSGRRLHEYFGQAIGASEEEIAQAWIMPADELSGKAAQIPEILECYQVDDCGAEGTVWQAFNALTRYETHQHGHNVATRQRSMLLGAGNQVANNAWGLALEAAA